jgi:hypothetical protein
MDYYSTPIARQQRPIGNSVALPERRRITRRALACRVTLTLPDKDILYGFTVDISAAGLRVAVPKKLGLDQECDLVLSFFANGKTNRVSARGQVLSCVCSGMDGFQLGIKFTQIDAAASEILQQILE